MVKNKKLVLKSFDSQNSTIVNLSRLLIATPIYYLYLCNRLIFHNATKPTIYRRNKWHFAKR